MKKQPVFENITDHSSFHTCDSLTVISACIKTVNELCSSCETSPSHSVAGKNDRDAKEKPQATSGEIQASLQVL